MDSALRSPRESVASIVESDTEADERYLLTRIAARDLEAMRAFYLAYHRRLTRFVARIETRCERIEHAVDDAFMIVWQRAAEFRGESRVCTWVMAIAWRHGLASLRRERRPAACLVLPETPPAVQAERSERPDALERGIDRMSPEDRGLIELAYAGGYSCGEMGVIMGIPASTVRTRLFDARRRLCAELETLTSASALLQ